MKCYPKCDLTLPDIGSAKVLTSFDPCRTPAELTLTIIHEVRSTSTFVSRDSTVDSRNIGTAHWPLKLNVQFLQNQPDQFYVKACIVTERHNSASCFMNSTYLLDEMGHCGTAATASSPAAMVVLSVLLTTLLFVLIAGTIFVLHKLFIRFCTHPLREKNYHKQSQCAALISPVEHHKYDREDDRLTVIEEEREETAQISPTHSEYTIDVFESRVSSFVPSEFRPSRPMGTIVSSSQPLLQTFKTPAQEV